MKGMAMFTPCDAVLRAKGRVESEGEPRGIPPRLAGIGLGAGCDIGGHPGGARRTAQRRLVYGGDQAVVVATLGIYRARLLRR